MSFSMPPKAPPCQEDTAVPVPKTPRTTAQDETPENQITTFSRKRPFSMFAN
ncbi:MAG: hypothetical protein H6667_13195 [Ardenticatenaceae bacterium]|nr:hypothetical protein [Ardenticatenaceae bacterium]MCB9442700.1 hypothetical protein [Ardenticatenaceae bacterium]